MNGEDHTPKPEQLPCEIEREALENQLDFMRALVDSAVDAIIVHEPDGAIVFYNRSARELLGLSEDEMDGLAPFGWVAEDARQGAAARLEAILYEGRHVFSSALRRKGEPSIPTEVTASRFDTTSGPLVVAVIRDASDRMAAQAHLEQLAYRDPLTGIPNRAAFEERLAQAIADVRRHGDLLLLAYIDLDRFKPVNDVYGHAAGDEVLIEVGQRLSGAIRAGDVVARLGGDEFVILLRRVESLDEVAGIAERLLRALRSPIETSEASIEVDAAIGFSVFDPSCDDARSLVVKADIAMYESKRCVNCSWQLYQPHMGGIDTPC